MCCMTCILRNLFTFQPVALLLQPAVFFLLPSLHLPVKKQCQFTLEIITIKFTQNSLTISNFYELKVNEFKKKKNCFIYTVLYMTVLFQAELKKQNFYNRGFKMF